MLCSVSTVFGIVQSTADLICTVQYSAQYTDFGQYTSRYRVECESQYTERYRLKKFHLQCFVYHIVQRTLYRTKSIYRALHVVFCTISYTLRYTKNYTDSTKNFQLGSVKNKSPATNFAMPTTDKADIGDFGSTTALGS